MTDGSQHLKKREAFYYYIKLNFLQIVKAARC